MLEKDIVNAILQYLQLKKIFAWRNNSGMIFGKDEKGRTYAHRMGPKGSPDIIGIMSDGRFLGIEVKVPGNKPTDEQSEFLEEIQKRGGIAFVAYSVDDVITRCG